MRKWVILFTIVLVSCQGNDLPEGVIPPEKMQKIFWDYISADIYVSEFVLHDTAINTIKKNIGLQKKIFEDNKITKEQFYSSYKYYVNHPDLMKNMLDTMIKRSEIVRKPNKKDLKKIFYE